jgi:hypothetical protein
MTSIAVTTTDYSAIGDVPVDVITPMLIAASSPMVPTAKATTQAASPHSALFWAQAWLENQWETTGHIITPHHHNPVSLRPEKRDDPGPYGNGVITASDGGQFLTFATDAQCAREWKRRLFDEKATYKGGAYRNARTLEDMLAIYAPSGDVHPVTGLDNADANYLASVLTMLNRFAKAEGEAPAPPQPSPPKEPTMGLTIKKRMVPTTNRNHPNTLLNPTGDLYIIVHETGNTGAGTGARMHADFVMNGGGSSSVAFHFAVDQTPEAYQMFALKWIGWHASDGCNSRADDWGCFRGVAIETCVNDGNRYKDQTRRNLATLIYMIITGDPQIDFGGVDHRRFSADRIRTHNQTAFDRKWCPTYMLNDGYVPVLVSQVRTLVSGVTPAPVNGLSLGDTAEVTEALNVRRGAGTNHPVTGVLQPGTRVTIITDGTTHVRAADGYTWLNVQTALGTGWVASEWLKKVVVAPPPKPVEYAPRVVIPELAALTVADRDTAAALVLKNGIHFITVWDEVEAIDTAVNLQFAYEGAKPTEDPSPKGTRRWVSHLFQADDKRWYYYDERANRLIASQWKRVNDAPDIDELVASLTGVLENAVA